MPKRNHIVETIAWRYLFSKKSHHAINIVSGVSAAGVMVVTAALVCVLSVMNGFNAFIESMFSQMDPQLRITSTEGKDFRLDSPALQAVEQMPEVAIFAPVIEEMAMIQYKDMQVPARVKGCDSPCHTEDIITDGEFLLYDGAFERCVLGRGLAAQVGINPHFVGALHVYAPKRVGKINRLRPDKSLIHLTTHIAGVFAVNQAQYDDELMLVSMPFARTLFEYDSLQVTSVEIALKEGSNLRQVKRTISQTLGDGYAVQDRYEQQADMFRIMRIEKWLTSMLLAFILLIACFNVIGSLSMLIIDKQEDTRTLANLGASPQLIQRIFRVEGSLIITLGAVAGLILGLIICLTQEWFGWLKLGDGTDFVISAYPVQVQGWDILLVIAMVTIIGFFSAWIPTRRLRLSAIAVLATLCLTGCDIPPYYPPAHNTATEFNYGRVVDYGVLYQEVGLDNEVVMLDLYSNGLRIIQGKMNGTGTNLCFEHVFLPAGENRLQDGTTFTMDTTGAEYTFLPGRDYDGNVTGAYILEVEDSKLQTITLIEDGTFTVTALTNDTTRIDCTLKLRGGKTYRASAKCKLQSAK